jgi:hypothetical protein
MQLHMPRRTGKLRNSHIRTLLWNGTTATHTDSGRGFVLFRLMGHISEQIYTWYSLIEHELQFLVRNSPAAEWLVYLQNQGTNSNRLYELIKVRGKGMNVLQQLHYKT